MGPIPSVMLSRRAKIALSVVAVLIVLIVLVTRFAGVYINYLWFGEVGHHNVYSTVIWTKVVLFFVFGILMAAIICGNLVVAYVTRPPFRPMSPEQQNLQHYVSMIEPRRRLVIGIVGLIALLSAGASAQGKWAQWQLYLHGASWGIKDPIFGKDVSFYTWDYPVYRLLLGFGFSAVIFSLILTVALHYVTGAIRLQTPGPKITMAARRQLTILIFFFIALKAIAYWLDRYGLLFSHRSKFTGASYTDVHAALPARTILFWIAVVLALGVLASLWLKSSILPGIGFVVLIVFSILIGGIYPAILQSVTVSPNASTKEIPYIKRNIAATRYAYGIETHDAKQPGGTVTYKKYDVDSSASSRAAAASLKSLNADTATTSNVRILDPNVLSPTFAQQQAQISNVYGFPSKLDVDRYTIGGTTQDYIVGVRELDAANLRGQQRNWINQYTNFTHGYGFVAAAADENVTTAGDDAYADGQIPPQGVLSQAFPMKNNSVYYGELLPSYAIVGAKGTPREFNGDGSGKVTYAGSGGISLSNPLTRLAFALHEKETNFLLNDAVSAKGARIMINRDPRQIVEKVAPFLKVDGDPYPILDTKTGHLTWMVDAYTTTDDFPYSERNSLSSLTSDSLTASNRTSKQPNDQVNYIRNSVKATVDAYTGKVHLYDWDSKDPVLKSWMTVFPHLVQPEKDMPAAVRSHIRYPEDLMEVQRNLLEQYHVSNPVTFYNVGNKWTVPNDPAQGATGNQPPYYVLANAGGTGSTPQFQLTTPMKVNSKQTLAAYITVDSQSGKDYGKMTVLKVENGATVPGPEQVANNFQSYDVVSSYISLNNRNGSHVIEGNLLTLPVGHSFLYVEPIYVQAASSGYPLLRRVLVQYNGNVGFGSSLTGALSDFLPGHTTGQTVQNGDTPSDTGGGSKPTSSSSPTSPTTGSSSSSSAPPPASNLPTTIPGVIAAIGRANDQLAAAKDLKQVSAAYQRLEQLSKQLAALRAAAGTTTPPASPTAATATP